VVLKGSDWSINTTIAAGASPSVRHPVRGSELGGAEIVKTNAAPTTSATTNPNTTKMGQSGFGFSGGSS
jgi:hypothetical protein